MKSKKSLRYFFGNKKCKKGMDNLAQGIIYIEG